MVRGTGWDLIGRSVWGPWWFFLVGFLEMVTIVEPIGGSAEWSASGTPWDFPPFGVFFFYQQGRGCNDL